MLSLRALSAACVAVSLLALAPSLALADALVSARDCVYAPPAGIVLAGKTLNNGALLACPLRSDGNLDLQITGATSLTNEPQKAFSTSTSYQVCPVGGGACVANGNTATNSYFVPSVTLPSAGGYVITVTAVARPNTGAGKVHQECSFYNNYQCIAICRPCTRTATATCYYNAPDQLAAAIAASPTAGAGSTADTLTGAAQVFGTPFAPSNFGATLPLQAGATLNPRCQINSLTFRKIYSTSAAIAASTLALTLPTDGTGELVIYKEQCDAFTPDQIAAFSATAPTMSGTYLTPAGPAICKDVKSYKNSAMTTTIDTAATDYTFAGDITAVAPTSGLATMVCDRQATPLNPLTGPMVQIPAAKWQTATFTLTAKHTTLESVCSDESCVGGNADGACSACSYTYTVRFACNTPAPVAAPTTPPAGESGGSQGGNAGSVIGDPQFVGLRGQKYQVHGVSGEVYSIVSSPSLQYNARFLFLDSGACPEIDGKVQRGGCFSHPGSYLSELGLKTVANGAEASDDEIRILAGSAKQGFTAVAVNERDLALGEKLLLADGGSVSRDSTHAVTVVTGQWSFVFTNSDGFINQQVAVSGELSTLRSHGLLGQTWREVAPASRGRSRSQLKDIIEGRVDDYVVREKDVFGDNFKFNAYV